MKTKLQFASVLFAICTLAQAQTSQLEYRPFVEENKMWETQVGGIKENVYRHFIEGDTIIAGENWKKVYNSYSFSRRSYYAAIREVDKKIFAIAKGSNKPRLLYDFSLKVGDLVRCGMEGNAFCCLLERGEKADSLFGFPFISYLRVERIDTIKYNDKLFRRFTLSALDAYEYPYYNDDGEIRCNIIWVEGIGSGAGPFYPWMPLPSLYFSRQSCSIDKQILFGSNGFCQDDYPSIVGSSKVEAMISSDVYDLQGRKLQQASQKGVYILNGKKVAVK